MSTQVKWLSYSALYCCLAMADKMGGDILLQVFRVELDEDYQHLMLEVVGKQEINQPTSLLRLANCKRETTCVVALTLQSGKQRCMLF